MGCTRRLTDVAQLTRLDWLGQLRGTRRAGRPPAFGAAYLRSFDTTHAFLVLGSVEG
jgi:hypothetical protein